MTVGVTSTARRGICKDVDIFRVPTAGDGGLARWLSAVAVVPRAFRHTCKDGGLQQLHELIDLYQHVDSHLQFRAGRVSIAAGLVSNRLFSHKI